MGGLRTRERWARANRRVGAGPRPPLGVARGSAAPYPCRMRLREVQLHLRRLLPSLQLAVTKEVVPGTTQAGVRIANATALREATNELAEIPGFASSARDIASHPAARVGDDTILPHEHVQGLESTLGAVRGDIDRLLRILDASVPEDDPIGLSILLPPTQSFSEITRSIETLHQSLDDCAVRVTKAGVRFSHLDTGSSWIVLIAVNHVVWSFIAKLLATVQRYRMTEIKCLEAEQHLRTLTINNDTLENLRDEQAKALKTLNEKLSKELAAEYPEADPDAANHIFYAVKGMSDLYARGTEVHRSLIASSPIPAVESGDALFPDHALLQRTLVGPTHQLGAKVEAAAAAGIEPPAEGRGPDQGQR